MDTKEKSVPDGTVEITSGNDLQASRRDALHFINKTRQ
jgi:hypothetical protein